MSSMAAEPPEIIRFENGKVVDDKTDMVIDLTSPTGQQICDVATAQGMKVSDFEGRYTWGCGHEPQDVAHIEAHQELVPA